VHHLATINLVQLDDAKRPIGHASACIVRYRHVYFVLTVAHATGNQGNWAMEIDFDITQSKARLFQLGGMSFLRRFRIKHGKVKARDIDFSYKLLSKPLHPRFQIVSPQGAIAHDEPKIILDSDLSVQPDLNEEYGFWGCTHHSYNTHDLQIVPKHETGMKFKEVKNDFLFFTTKLPYKSYKDYVGCSGAPILDSHGRLVSLVVEGDKKKTGIYGLPLYDLRPFLDVEIQQSQLA
jgi:hypothetical protein